MFHFPKTATENANLHKDKMHHPQVQCQSNPYPVDRQSTYPGCDDRAPRAFEAHLVRFA